eukprot:scaffold120756_cov33-Tisochrysis_lutea.AAC.2
MLAQLSSGIGSQSRLQGHDSQRHGASHELQFVACAPQIPAEFNPRKHEFGVLSMARSADPNSGGSQVKSGVLAFQTLGIPCDADYARSDYIDDGQLFRFVPVLHLPWGSAVPRQ